VRQMRRSQHWVVAAALLVALVTGAFILSSGSLHARGAVNCCCSGGTSGCQMCDTEDNLNCKLNTSGACPSPQNCCESKCVGID
jgi:hypothetical protein